MFPDGLLFLSVWLLIGSLASPGKVLSGGIPAPQAQKTIAFLLYKQTEKGETVIPSSFPMNAGQSRFTFFRWSEGDALQSTRLFPIKLLFT